MVTLVKNNIPDDLMEGFSSYLEEGMGLHYTKDRWGDLEKRMRPVAKDLGFSDLKDCIATLIKKPITLDLITILAYYLTIGETYFFRDRKRMEALETKILPEIIQKHKNDKKIRIWSVACCTGEEPYSIAIMLDRLLPQREEWDISILGSDINKEFLRKAEIGNYTKWSFRATPQDLRAKYFVSHKEGVFSLIPRVKKMVTFSYFNMIEDSYSNMLNEMDLVLCHNVLIYFSPRQITKAIHQLSNSLKNDGWLSISAIETPFVNESHLAVRTFDGAIFFKKTDKIQPTKKEVVVAPPKMPSMPIKEDESLLKVVFPDFIKMQQPVIEFPFTSKDLEQKEIKIPEVKSKKQPPPIDLDELYNNKKYREIVSSLKTLQNNPDFIKNNPSKVVLLVRTYANLGELSEALSLCETALNIEKLDPDLYYIHATVSIANKDTQQAIKSLRKTLFIEPNHIAAHFMLGTLLQQSNPRAAKKSFEIALELLEDFEPDEKLVGDDELTVSRVKDIIENSMRGFHG